MNDIEKLDKIIKQQDLEYARMRLAHYPIIFEQVSIDDLDNKERMENE
jgi:hypothetical protein